MQSSSRPPGCARNCPLPYRWSAWGPKGVPYQVTHPLSTKYTLPQLLYFMCRMSYEHGQKQVSKTMDQLKRLSIPSEMLTFFNHACHPRLGHPCLGHLTRSVNLPPMTYTTYNVWTWPKASVKDPGRSVHFTPHEHTQNPTYERGPKQMPKTFEGQCT